MFYAFPCLILTANLGGRYYCYQHLQMEKPRCESLSYHGNLTYLAQVSNPWGSNWELYVSRLKLFLRIVVNIY